IQNDVEVEKEIVDVSVTSLNEPVDGNVFQLAGMGFTPGTPISGLDPQGKLMRWNGSETEYKPPAARQMRTTDVARTGTSWLWICSITLALLSVATLLQHRLRKKRA